MNQWTLVSCQASVTCQFQTLDLTDCCLETDTVTNFMHLQELVLTYGSDQVCKLKSCTQLTKLELLTPGRNFRQLVLPSDGLAHLQHLHICGRIQHQADYTMNHLGAAQCLTSLELHNAYPSNLTPADWPVEMPCLHKIKLYGLQAHISP